MATLYKLAKMSLAAGLVFIAPGLIGVSAQDKAAALSDSAIRAAEYERFRERLTNYVEAHQDLISPRVRGDLLRLIGEEEKSAGQTELPGEGMIVEPRFGAEVETAIPVSVRISQPKADEHLWLAVEHGGLLWPKEPEVLPTNGEWSGSVHEGGVTGRLNLQLISVSEQGHRRILEWFDAAGRSGRYAGLMTTDLNATTLDSVMLQYRKGQ